MDIYSVYEDCTRDQLIEKLWAEGVENNRLKTLLTTVGEELVRLGSSSDELLEEIENRERKWLPSYSIGGYNQMRMYIKELEDLVGPEANKLRQDRHKYLTDWFKETEPK